jgi:hypothetical protein
MAPTLRVTPKGARRTASRLPRYKAAIRTMAMVNTVVDVRKPRHARRKDGRGEADRLVSFTGSLGGLRFRVLYRSRDAVVPPICHQNARIRSSLVTVFDRLARHPDKGRGFLDRPDTAAARRTPNDGLCLERKAETRRAAVVSRCSATSARRGFARRETEPLSVAWNRLSSLLCRNS